MQTMSQVGGKLYRKLIESLLLCQKWVDFNSKKVSCKLILNKQIIFYGNT